MTSPKTPGETVLRYTGGVSPLILIFTPTGRKVTIERGDYLSLNPIEAPGLDGRPDFEVVTAADEDPTPTTTPDPDPDPDEEIPAS